MKNKRRLNIKEEKFVLLYLKYGEGKKAAEEAGWSPKSSRSIASRKLADPRIKEAIEEAKKDLTKVLGLDALWVMKKAKEIVDVCSTKILVQPKDENRPSYFAMVDPHAARNALLDIARWVGMEEKKAPDLGQVGVLLVNKVNSEEEWLNGTK